MTSHPREEELALYSTADLDQSQLTRIAEHLDNCAGCRDCLARFEHVGQMLASVAAEPSTEDLLEVRQRVMHALDSTRKRHLGFQWAAAVAALAVLALLLHHKPHAKGEIYATAAKIATVQPPPVAPVRATVQTKPVVRRSPRLHAPGLRSIALITRPGEEPLIRIATADPKVLILLPPDPQKDERTESNE